MVNFGFSSETGHKYENYSSQSHAGTIGAVSIFNSIVLVILLAPGKFQKCDFENPQGLVCRWIVNGKLGIFL